MKFAKLMMAAAVAAGMLFVVTGCGKGETPTQSFQNMIKALQSGDLQTANKYSVMQMQALPPKTSGIMTDSFTVIKEEINGDIAVITTTCASAKGAKWGEEKLELKKIDGIWKFSGKL